MKMNERLRYWTPHLLGMGTFFCFLGMYLGTSFLSLSSTIVLALGLPAVCLKYRELFRHPLFKPFGFLLLAVIVSIVAAEPFPFSKPILKLRYFLCLFVSSYVFSGYPLLRDRILKFAFFIPFILGPLAILQRFELIDILDKWFHIQKSSHATGLLTHHTAFGISMAYVFHLVFPQISQTSSRRFRVFAALSCLFCVVAVLCSFSRGALAALVVSFGVVLFLGRVTVTKLAVSSLAGLFCVLLVFSNSALKDRFTSFDKSKYRDRIELSSFAWDEFKKHPLVGHGFGRFPFELEKYPERKERAGGHSHAHNIYLDLLAGSGLLGFFCFVWFLWIISKQVYSCFRVSMTLSEKTPTKRMWSLGILGIWVAFLTGGLFDEFLLWSQISIPTATLIGSAFDWSSFKND